MACKIPPDPDNILYFELPRTSIKGIPLIVGDQKLCIGFVEVGCKPAGKRKALRSKRDLLYDFWRQNYQQEHGVDWQPIVFRAIAHYDTVRVTRPDLGDDLNDVDLELFYSTITGDMLERLSDKDKEQIFRVVKSNKKRRNLLERILVDNDAEQLHGIIVGHGHVPEESDLRGKMAEILVLKDLEYTLPRGMNLFRNGDIRYFNERYKNGTEVDGIQTFYSVQDYLSQIESLRSLDHLMVRHRWHDE